MKYANIREVHAFNYCSAAKNTNIYYHSPGDKMVGAWSLLL